MIVDGNGNVGIGTGIPLNALQVKANTNTTGVVIDQTGTGGILDLRDAGVSKMVVDANGNVGIGTSNPMSKLDINGTVNQSFIGCHVRNSQNITSGTLTTLVYTSIFESSGHYSTSTGKFTAPIAGYYHVTFTCLNQPSLGNNTYFIYKNSGVQISTNGWSLANEYGNTTLTAITYLGVNDTVYTQAKYTQGGYSAMTIFRLC